MKLNLREYFKLSAIYILVAALPPILQLVVQPIIEGPERLGAVDFSYLSIGELITSLAFTFAIFSMGNAVARFYYDHGEDKDQYKKLVSTVFNSILVRGALLLGLAWLFSSFIGSRFSQPALQDFSSYGYLAIIIGINRAINMTAATLYRNEKRVKRFVILNVSLGIFRTALQLIGVFYYDMSFIGFLWGGAIGSSLTSIAIIIYTWRKCGIRINWETFSATHIFASPLFIYGLLFWGINYLERLFLEGKPTDLGIYGITIGLAIGLEKILIGIQGATQPEIYRLMKEGIEENMADIKKLSSLLLAQTQVIIALAIIPAMVYLNVFYTTEVRLGYTLIAIVFVKFILRTQYVIFSYGVYFKKKTKYFLYVNTIVLMVNLGINYFLVPIYSYYGIIIAMLTSLFLQSIMFYYVNRKITGIQWNTKKMLYFPFLVILCAGIFEVLKIQFDLNPYLTSALLTIFLVINLLIAYKAEIRHTLLKYI